MRFNVLATTPANPPVLGYVPTAIDPLRTDPIVDVVTGKTPDVTRQLTLNEAMGPGGPLEVLVNNTKWSGKSLPDNFPSGIRPDFLGYLSGAYYSELPKEGRPSCGRSST
jgi:hypothetical protein